MVKVGLIGGSGLDDPKILKDARDVIIETSFGTPSPITMGNISGVEVALFARHGRQHTIPPTQVNNRANICAMKDLGCTHILATTAVGSLREEIGRGDLVIPDQFIDFTRRRHLTFYDKFEPHSAAHTAMPEPFNEHLREALIASAWELSLRVHPKGTVLTIEGPRFSTRAESRMYRNWGADVVNMSTAPEVILANEASIPYAVVAMSTDYDAWKDNEEPVSWDAIVQIFSENVEKVVSLLLKTIPRI